MRRQIVFRDARLKSFVIFIGCVFSISWTTGMSSESGGVVDPNSGSLYAETTRRQRTVDEETSAWIPHDAEHLPSDHDHPDDKIYKENEAASDEFRSEGFACGPVNRVTIYKVIKLPQ